MNANQILGIGLECKEGVFKIVEKHEPDIIEFQELTNKSTATKNGKLFYYENDNTRYEKVDGDIQEICQSYPKEDIFEHHSVDGRPRIIDWPSDHRTMKTDFIFADYYLYSKITTDMKGPIDFFF